MARNIVIGIDVGTSTTETVVLEAQGSGEGLRILGAGMAPSCGLRRGCVVNETDARDSIRASVREAERTSGIGIKHAYVAMGGCSLSSVRSKGTVIVSRADGEVTQHDVKRAVGASETNLSSRIVNKHVIHVFPIVFTIDNDLKTNQPVGIKGARLEVEALFITCLNQHLNSLIKSVESAGIIIDDVIAAPLAAARTLLTKSQKEVGVALVNIGGGTVTLAAFEEGLPISIETFPMGSNHITHDIALGLQASIEEAENLKLAYASDHSLKRKLSEIIEPRLGDIFDLVEGHLKKVGRNGLLPAGIVLGGGGSNIFNIAEIARSSLKLPAQVGVSRLEGLNEKMKDPAWSVAIGLCLTALDENNGSVLEGGAMGQTKSFFLKWLRSFLP